MGKKCSCCKQEKTLEDFHKNKSRHDGLSHVCKDCKKQKSFAYNKILNHSEHYAKHNRYYKKKANNRKQSVRAATPSWLTEKQKFDIDALYFLAEDCRIISGEQYHIDHIIPLKGKDVCGLHVPWNLQVLPSDINISKSNKTI